jgi:DNA polymerase-3 subunit delta'
VKFEDLVGQQTAVAVLRNALRRGRVAHAYLFAGPEQVGKRTAALCFAKALNCLTPSPDAPRVDGCDDCTACRQIEGNRHPSVRLISPLGRGEEAQLISIHQIRPATRDQDRKRFPPSESLEKLAHLRAMPDEWRVFIIDPADRMSVAASNALLHTLEEPPAQVVIVLITARSGALLDTIRSRCQEVPFRLAGAAPVEQLLQECEGVSADRARTLAAQSGGRVGWAVEAARQPDAPVAESRRLFEFLGDLSDAAPSAALRLADTLKAFALEAADEPAPAGEGEAEDEGEARPGRPNTGRVIRAQLPAIFDRMLTWYRDLLVMRESDPALVIFREEQDLLREQAPRWRSKDIERAIAAILESKQALERNANVELTLEALLIRLLRLSRNGGK